MERRNPNPPQGPKPIPSALPSDYVKMVQDVFTTHFAAGLKAISKHMKKPQLTAGGAVYPNEVIVTLTLTGEGQLAATTAYASCDFDPKASVPTIQDLLAACVDALGSVFGELLVADHPEKLEQLAESSLSAFEELPFNWTAMQVDRHRVFVKVDKSNPALDEMADQWLAKNDPGSQEPGEGSGKTFH